MEGEGEAMAEGGSGGSGVGGGVWVAVTEALLVVGMAWPPPVVEMVGERRSAAWQAWDENFRGRLCSR